MDTMLKIVLLVTFLFLAQSPAAEAKTYRTKTMRYQKSVIKVRVYDDFIPDNANFGALTR